VLEHFQAERDGKTHSEMAVLQRELERKEAKINSMQQTLQVFDEIQQQLITTKLSLAESESQLRSKTQELQMLQEEGMMLRLCHCWTVGRSIASTHTALARARINGVLRLCALASISRAYSSSTQRKHQTIVESDTKRGESNRQTNPDPIAGALLFGAHSQDRGARVDGAHPEFWRRREEEGWLDIGRSLGIRAVLWAVLNQCNGHRCTRQRCAAKGLEHV
jgi:hypothetical protein